MMTSIMIVASVMRRSSGSSYPRLAGDLESIVIQQMECLEKSNSENDISESICLHFYECICFGGIEIMVLWVYDGFKDLGQGEFSFRPGVTLCSLSVRMDD